MLPEPDPGLNAPENSGRVATFSAVVINDITSNRLAMARNFFWTRVHGQELLDSSFQPTISNDSALFLATV